MNNRNNYNNNNNNNNNQMVKKSGATYSKIKNGNFVGGTIVNAWNSGKRRGLLTCTVAPYKDSKQYTGEQNGNTYMTMMANVLYHNSGVEKLMPCSMNLETQVINLPEIGMCITPNGRGTTASGKTATGYFGKWTRN